MRALRWGARRGERRDDSPARGRAHVRRGVPVRSLHETRAPTCLRALRLVPCPASPLQRRDPSFMTHLLRIVGLWLAAFLVALAGPVRAAQFGAHSIHLTPANSTKEDNSIRLKKFFNDLPELIVLHMKRCPAT